jgi:hypothetical protein
MLMKVDLPAPFGPSRPKNEPRGNGEIDALQRMDGRALALGAIGFIEAARLDGELGRRL